MLLALPFPLLTGFPPVAAGLAGGWQGPSSSSSSSSVPPCPWWGGGKRGWGARGGGVMLTPAPRFPAGVCPPQSQHRRHPQAALGKDPHSGDRRGLRPTTGLGATRGLGPCSKSPFFVPSQVPARTAERPPPASRRGPSTRPAPRGTRAGWRGDHGTVCHHPTGDGTASCLLPPQERAGATGPGRRRERGAGGWGGRQGHERRGRGAGAAWADVSAPQILPAASGGGGSVVPKRPARGDGAGGLGDGGQGWFVAASPRPCLSFPVHCR